MLGPAASLCTGARHWNLGKTTHSPTSESWKRRGCSGSTHSFGCGFTRTCVCGCVSARSCHDNVRPSIFLTYPSTTAGQGNTGKSMLSPFPPCRLATSQHPHCSWCPRPCQGPPLHPLLALGCFSSVLAEVLTASSAKERDLGGHRAVGRGWTSANQTSHLHNPRKKHYVLLFRGRNWDPGGW